MSGRRSRPFLLTLLLQPHGDNYALSSRLIPTSVLKSSTGKEDVIKAILTASTYIDSWTIALTLPYARQPAGVLNSPANALTSAFYKSPWMVYFTEPIVPGMSNQERIVSRNEMDSGGVMLTSSAVACA